MVTVLRSLAPVMAGIDRRISTLAATIAGATLVATGLIWSSIASRGFPDGHRTELDLAQLSLARLVLPGLLVLGVDFAILSVVARRRAVRWWFWGSVVALVAWTVGSCLVNGGLAARLDDGHGG